MILKARFVDLDLGLDLEIIDINVQTFWKIKGKDVFYKIEILEDAKKNTLTL